MLPAFSHARPHVELTALVSDTPAKLTTAGPALRGRRRSVPTTTRASCSSSGDIDAVYIALPNTLHAAWTIRAAEAGLHVLCEKPLATTVRDCERMIDACERNDVQLMTAYRLHFERCNLEVAAIVRKKTHRRCALLRLAVLDAGEARQHPPRTRARRRARNGTSASTARTPRATCSPMNPPRCGPRPPTRGDRAIHRGTRDRARHHEISARAHRQLHLQLRRRRSFALRDRRHQGQRRRAIPHSNTPKG